MQSIGGKRVGLILGPVVSLSLFFWLNSSSQLGYQGSAVSAVAILMAIWWMTEALPISATAMLPIPLFPLLGIATVADTTAPYAHNLIFLFMGGFLLGIGMQRWNLHKRIALNVLSILGNRAAVLIAGFMVITAIFSMWVSNTATVVMMLPIGMSVIELLGDEAEDNFAVCLMLGLAYGGSIGGIATLIGTPPNALLAAFMQDELGINLSFQSWMKLGLPITCILLPITWFLLTKFLFPLKRGSVVGTKELFKSELSKLGGLRAAELIVMIVFTCTALAWIFRPLIAKYLPGIDDTVIAMTGGLLLFILPSGNKDAPRILSWKETTQLPWGVLLLFGGGLSLAAALARTGVTEFIGTFFIGMENVPPLLVILSVVTVVIFLTEMTSNTAMIAAFLPVLFGISGGLGVEPYLLLIPAAVGASCAFMLPVATPPNALVFASGKITISQMVHAGFWLNIISIFVVSIMCYLFAETLLGL